MKKLVKMLSLFLVVVTLLSTQTATFAFAATKSNAKKVTSTEYYNCDSTVTMTVKTTKKNATMKLNCKAAKYAEKFGIGIARRTIKHTCKVAPKMIIEVSPKVNGKSVFYLQGSGKSISSTLKFGEAGTYTVTVKYLRAGCNHCTISNNGEYYHDFVADAKDYCDGNWKVSSSKNLDITKIKVK